MDVLKGFPPKQEGRTIFNQAVTAFALSLQGASHVQGQIPCQDYNELRYMEQEKLCLAAVADGVGSCRLSHWGAYVAVNSALDYLQEQLAGLAKGQPMQWEAQADKLLALLEQAFIEAEAKVTAFAQETRQDAYAFQSTLTVAVYDGCRLFYGHIGDDGLVVQTQAGEVKMVTERMKGEEVSSVCPLQGGHGNWSFAQVAEPVAAFVLATDGVLDAFVAKRADSFGINYNNGVCYSFLEEGIYKLAQCEESSITQVLERYKGYMLGDSFRSVVQDDLTLVMVVAPALLKKAKRPRFNKAIWDVIERESNQEKRNRLWGNKKTTTELDACLDNVMRFTGSVEVKATGLPKLQFVLMGFVIGLVIGWLAASYFMIN